MVNAAKAMLKQNKDLREQAAELRRDIQQLEKTPERTKAEVGERHGVKNGYIRDTQNDLKERIATAVQERNKLQRQMGDLQREVNMLTEIVEVKSLPSIPSNR